MNQYQEEGYKEEALAIEEKLKDQGYLPPDIVAVAYMILKNNIDSAEKFERKASELTNLIDKTESLLKDL
ncbi:hypothetical protein AAGG74_15120 [Bacillus mexicanus]|uniref:hypothetical protein n=1 Tax=Bacillus mexicanus TaxID=2834415 RepID=UPI003D202D77